MIWWNIAREYYQRWKIKEKFDKLKYFNFKINLPDKRCDPDFCLIILIKLELYE